MPKKEKQPETPNRTAYRVKPRLAVTVRGLEHGECQHVDLSPEELLAVTVPGLPAPVVPAADFEFFMAEYAAGHTDCYGRPITPEAPEAQGTEAGE